MKKILLTLFLLSVLSVSVYADSYKCTVQDSYSMFEEDDRTIVDGVLKNRNISSSDSIDFIIDEDTGSVFGLIDYPFFISSGENFNNITNQGLKHLYFKGYQVSDEPGRESLTTLEIQHSWDNNPFLLSSGFKVYAGSCDSY